MKCENCGNPILQTNNGWTHGGLNEWQGRRCPRRLSLAMPELVGVEHICHSPEDACNRHHNGAGDCLEGCQHEPMETICITPTSPRERWDALDAVPKE